MNAIKIVGVGSYIPEMIKKNEDFLENKFFNQDETAFDALPEVIIKKFKAITGIEERRYVDKHLKTSDIAAFAAEKAIKNAEIDPETLDYIIVAHNFGDVSHNAQQADTVPSLASRVKEKLQIDNPSCVAYDLLFGCPGWIEGCIHSFAFMKAGMAKRCLIIGAETLSRVVDPNDRDSMIYADGAGATIFESKEGSGGILAHKSATYAKTEANYIYFDKSFSPDREDDRAYIKMYGRKIYNFALSKVPEAMKSCLEESGKSIEDLKKIFIHQANEKMDEAIVQRFYKLYDKEAPKDVMPMSIDKLGNSSVATIPTLYDMFLKGDFEHESLKPGDTVMFASVGAGMNINAIVYEI
ncbi:ketoacyl-ACP synthase III [Psychroflexus sp. YR1-1]|uniref:Ketoacyl-ACP synthase III n=1 Tax=Psychroflexus aurantiacus TaxID=2709310 RepID=A0A6B3R307_9FLAO|nr:ketoacyl-ACP synthase III [Psychroflexus aurantiacus]NEV95026.1 ketoacyl-ACP synthase III [Psychroflexus aurantiacus]